MYNKRFNSEKTVSIEQGTTIAFVTKSGTVMGEHCIRQFGNDDNRMVVIAYNLIPAAAQSLSSKTHSAKDDDRRAYYILDIGKDMGAGKVCPPHIHRAETYDAPCSFQKNTAKRVLAFAGDADGVEVTVSPNGMTYLGFTPKLIGEDAKATAYIIDLGKLPKENDDEAGKVRRMPVDSVRNARLVTLH